MKRPLLISLCLVLSAACSLFSVPASQMSSTPIGDSRQATSTVGPIEIENARLDYYSIFGSSESELRAQLDAKAPLGYDGYKGDATTNWFIRWDWPGYGNSSCDLSMATVSYEIVVTFPRWTPPDGTPPDLVAKWDSFTRDLAEHEQNHVDFVVDNYLSVLDAIRHATCQTADAAATSALEPIRQLDRDYDAATNHGESEGVRFP
jgi:predicted secreted Zn-dependent protease